jgi:ppGpp synthetase/RelA/SpoT-type nucleotidyltranferase
MKIVYGISRWTNASKPSARHIDNGKGKPLCGDKRKVFSWEKDEGEPTCQKCISMLRINPKSTRQRNHGIMGSTPGECYMWAYRYLESTGEGNLIHGTIWSPILNVWMGHAWVECEDPDYIYEPTTDKILSKYWFNANIKSKNIRRYNRFQAIHWAIKTGNYGPWENEKGLFIEVKKKRSRNPDIESYRKKFRISLDSTVYKLQSLFPQSVQSRLKTRESIEEKLLRKNKPIEAMTDIAGARIIFSDLNSLYKGADQIRDMFHVIEEIDYINQPKQGYRSYHFVVIEKDLPVEIQLKTPRMLEWGEVSHIEFPIYKNKEELRKKYGKDLKKMEKYHMRVSEYYARRDRGQQAKKPKAPRLWIAAGLPTFIYNPCPNCNTMLRVKDIVICPVCGKHLLLVRVKR